MIGTYPDHEKLIGIRGEHFAPEQRSSGLEGGNGKRVFQIKRTDIFGNLPLKMEMKMQCSGGKIALGIVIKHLGTDEGIRLGKAVFPDQSAGAGKVLKHLRAVSVFGKPRPESIFIERNGLLRCSAVNHCADSAVAEREGALPVSRRFLVIQKSRTLIHDRKSFAVA